MSAPRPPRPEFFSGLLSTVTWAAASFAGIGLLSWGLDRDPVSQPVGPAFSFGALAAAGLLVWLVSAYSARARTPWLGMAVAAVGSYLVICAVAFAVSLGLLLEQAASPFVALATLLAPGAVLLCWALARLPPPG